MSQKVRQEDIVGTEIILQIDRNRPILVINTPEYLMGLVSNLFSTKYDAQVRAREYSHIENVGVLKSREIAAVVGSNFDSKTLADLGYQKVDRVWEEGEYSVLGDVVTVWEPSSDNPIRISLWGEKIESIEMIDKDTRLSAGTLKSVVFGSGKISDGKILRSYVSSAKDGSNTLELIFVRDAFDTDEYESLYSIVDPGLKTIPGLQVYSDRKQLENLLKLYRSQGYKVFVITSDKGKIPRDIQYDKYIELTDRSPSRGFVNTKERNLCLTDTELLGQVSLVSSKKPSNRFEEIFKNLVPGDYVVHVDHGIGIFEGLVEQNGGLYIELRYADKDRLMVPVEQSEKIDKYLGAGRGTPVLTGLGSGSWGRIRRKARVDAVKVAQELIRLYAMRNVVKTDKLVDGSVAEDVRKLVSEFKYEDTEDQKVITEQLVMDLASDRPMDRLIVGDVGFGKTELAIRAAYAAVLAGKQVAFLAPTTVLVEQHLAVFRERLEDKGVRVEVLSRLRTHGEKNKLIADLENGSIDIIVGTHALLSDAVQFKDLGLLIIDEEQKFGVKQKEKMKEKRLSVHVLSLTATPIPRTLNMSLNMIKDMSILASVPPGRKPIANHFEKFSWEVVKKAIKDEVKRGGQVYYLHNRVRDIKNTYKKLQDLLPDVKIDIMHGQMSSASISSVMRKFVSGEIDVLLCTTIIENGLDLPNVNTLIVEGAENFGLSQLYQIRGRIGRSERQAYAYFLHGAFVGEAASRLGALKEADYLGSGYLLSNRDLEIRGVGDILGTSQSGAINAIGYAMYSRILSAEIEKLKKGSI